MITFIMLPFYTIYLSTNEYGTIDLINSVVLLLTPIITLGIADAIFRFIMSKDYDNISVFSAGVLINIVGWLILCVLFVCCSMIQHPNNIEYMIIILVMLLVTTLYSLLSNFAKAVNKIYIYSFTGFLQTLIFVTLNIYFIKTLSYGINGYLSASIISNGICCIVLFIILQAWKFIDFKKINKQTLKVMIKYSLPLIPTTLSWWVIMLSDRYMITYFLGLSENGIYAVSNKIPTILNTIVVIFVQSWQISSISMYENDSNQLDEFYTRSIAHYEFLNFILGSILIFVSPLLMKLLVRGEYGSGWIAVPFLIISIVFSSLSGYVTTIFSAYKNNFIVCVSVVVGAIINIILNYILINSFGIIGAAISSSIAYLSVFLIRLIYSKRIVEYKLSLKVLILNSLLIYGQAFLMLFNNIFSYGIQVIIIILFFIVNHSSSVSLFKMVYGLKVRLKR